MLWPIAGGNVRTSATRSRSPALLLDRPDLSPWGIQEEGLLDCGTTGAGASRPTSGPSAPARPASSPSGRGRSQTPGYFVARGDAGSHAVFDVGAHGYLNGGHAHADALALTLSLRGRSLLIDPGTSTYTMNPSLRDRLRSSMSHNTVSVGNRSHGIPSGPFHWESLRGCDAAGLAAQRGVRLGRGIA
jgi:hypothetical protein